MALKPKESELGWLKDWESVKQPGFLSAMGSEILKALETPKDWDLPLVSLLPRFRRSDT